MFVQCSIPTWHVSTCPSEPAVRNEQLEDGKLSVDGHGQWHGERAVDTKIVEPSRSARTEDVLWHARFCFGEWPARCSLVVLQHEASSKTRCLLYFSRRFDCSELNKDWIVVRMELVLA